MAQYVLLQKEFYTVQLLTSFRALFRESTDSRQTFVHGAMADFIFSKQNFLETRFCFELCLRKHRLNRHPCNGPMADFIFSKQTLDFVAHGPMADFIFSKQTKIQIETAQKVPNDHLAHEVSTETFLEEKIAKLCKKTFMITQFIKWAPL